MSVGSADAMQRERARKALGGRAATLRCGGRRFAETPLRAKALASALAFARRKTVRRDGLSSGLSASVPGGERRTRPRTGGISLRELPVLGARTGCARRIALRRCATPG